MLLIAVAFFVLVTSLLPHRTLATASKSDHEKLFHLTPNDLSERLRNASDALDYLLEYFDSDSPSATKDAIPDKTNLVTRSPDYISWVVPRSQLTRWHATQQAWADVSRGEENRFRGYSLDETSDDDFPRPFLLRYHEVYRRGELLGPFLLIVRNRRGAPRLAGQDVEQALVDVRETFDTLVQRARRQLDTYWDTDVGRACVFGSCLGSVFGTLFLLGYHLARVYS